MAKKKEMAETMKEVLLSQRQWNFCGQLKILGKVFNIIARSYLRKYYDS